MEIENIRPLADRALVKRLPREQKTEGGIIIPDIAQEKGQIGEVVAVGAGRVTPDGKAVPMQIKRGDKVLFGKYGGNEVLGEYILLREDEILGVIEK